MKSIVMIGVYLLTAIVYSAAQSTKPKARIENTTTEYKGKIVKAKKLTVSSEFPMPLEAAWEAVKTPKLLKLVTKKGKIKFVKDDFPEVWQEKDTSSAKMRLFGFIPYGGKHYVFVERIDEVKKEIQTREWDKSVKVWNHFVQLRSTSPQSTAYTDEIIIYAKWRTGIVAQFAKSFYKYRQKRWRKLAEGKLKL